MLAKFGAEMEVCAASFPYAGMPCPVVYLQVSIAGHVIVPVAVRNSGHSCFSASVDTVLGLTPLLAMRSCAKLFRILVSTIGWWISSVFHDLGVSLLHDLGINRSVMDFIMVYSIGLWDCVTDSFLDVLNFLSGCTFWSEFCLDWAWKVYIQCLCTLQLKSKIHSPSSEICRIAGVHCTSVNVHLPSARMLCCSGYSWWRIPSGISRGSTDWSQSHAWRSTCMLGSQ